MFDDYMGGFMCGMEIINLGVSILNRGIIYRNIMYVISKHYVILMLILKISKFYRITYPLEIDRNKKQTASYCTAMIIFLFFLEQANSYYNKYSTSY